MIVKVSWSNFSTFYFTLKYFHWKIPVNWGPYLHMHAHADPSCMGSEHMVASSPLTLTFWQSNPTAKASSLKMLRSLSWIPHTGGGWGGARPWPDVASHQPGSTWRQRQASDKPAGDWRPDQHLYSIRLREWVGTPSAPRLGRFHNSWPTETLRYQLLVVLSCWVLRSFVRWQKRTEEEGDSLAVQWLGTRPALQGTPARSLLREDSTRGQAIKPTCHNYRACAP